MNLNPNFVRTFRLWCMLLLALCMATSCEDGGEQGEYLRAEPEEELEVDTLRLISYNILEGMKLDQTTGKTELAAWVRSMNPDILALQEANKFTQESLERLAASYGHPYVVTNIKKGDNYPVALTSKYPVEVIAKITEGVSHGAIHVRIRGVNIVVLHLWPHATGSNGYADGNSYRMAEITAFLDGTLKAHPGEVRWLMMGDFNSVSPLDADDLPGGVGLNYDVHTKVLGSGYHDLMRSYRGYFIPSCPTAAFAGGNATRIDFIYGSSAMLSDMTCVETVRDDFTDTRSDHYPLMTEFRVYGTKQL
ncbi:MAG: endonuclease/exonuclease/phosphatase family protein [Alistipes sp.]|uniref:endonuclease/exonuclease/phosphatase family protein n=1 Tax=Alistipes sp. TaxID=1872444 RepID=UPI001D4C0E32|nr:endonuclease/exonuclease/phosphatase family protein [Alistipes sp.]MBS5018600.1 endonuclease/exonuclease/phosphatase family protein [Alistipes sp.]